MSMGSEASSHPALGYTDRFATSAGDAILLVSRVLLGWMFLVQGWSKLINIPAFAAYLNNLKVPNAGFWAWIASLAEFFIGIALILGIATRYAALFTFVYLIIATALAHRYWEYPQAQQTNQFNHFLKNLALMGGAAIIFVTGAGRFSVDRLLARRR